ncbi:MAG: hypothetical protein IPL53_08370 [Ignavibacteria bacterium]|nr:hypothetical protein [Ignavibacteria bacterium]
MKGETLFFAVLIVLFLSFISPDRSTANPAAIAAKNNSLSSGKVLNSHVRSVIFQRVLIDGVWWILVFDSGKLINAFPE